MNKWKTLSSTPVLKHKRLTVYEDQVELPNGQTTDYIHFGKTADAVAVIAINDEGKILIQKEYSYPPNEWLFQFPGGAVNAGEEPVEGAVRELSEECNLTGDFEHLNTFYLDYRKRADLMHAFICTNLKEKIAEKDVEEIFEEHWLAPAEIDAMVANGEIVTSTSLAAWALFTSKRTDYDI